MGKLQCEQAGKEALEQERDEALRQASAAKEEMLRNQQEKNQLQAGKKALVQERDEALRQVAATLEMLRNQQEKEQLQAESVEVDPQGMTAKKTSSESAASPSAAIDDTNHPLGVVCVAA